MRTDLPAGKFKLTWERCTATYESDGEIIFAHYIRRGRYYHVPDRHWRIRAWLTAQGKQEANLLATGILRRKAARRG